MTLSRGGREKEGEGEGEMGRHGLGQREKKMIKKMMKHQPYFMDGKIEISLPLPLAFRRALGLALVGFCAKSAMSSAFSEVSATTESFT